MHVSPLVGQTALCMILTFSDCTQNSTNKNPFSLPEIEASVLFIYREVRGGNAMLGNLSLM